MITIADYINLILKKKKWTKARLVREINKIEETNGDTEHTRKQNLTNNLSYNYIRPKFAKKLEKALGLKDDDLLRFVGEPISKQGKRALRDVKKELGGDIK